MALIFKHFHKREWYVQTTYGRLSRMQATHNIKSVGLPPRKISSLLRPVKDNLGLRTPGVYSIPCECGQVYIGQTGRTIDTRIKQHSRHIRLGRWRIIGSPMITSLDSKIPKSSLPNLATWTESSGRRSSWSSTQTIWTGKKAWP
jgi:hypothetical protein